MKFRIGITGTGSLIGQAIIKSVKNSSFKESHLVGMDYFENTIGSYWTDKNYLLPDILNESITKFDWLTAVITIIKLEKIDILFIGVDFELHLFAEFKMTIENETNCLIVVSDLNTILIGDDKYLTYQFLKDNALYYPETFKGDELELALEKLPFPMILKPRNGYRSVDVYIIHSENELRQKINTIQNPIIQEYIGDKNAEYTCGTICFDNQVKQSIVLRRDLKEGNTSTTYLDDNIPSNIKPYIEKVSAALNQFGVCNFQLRIDKNGLPKIFEINARHSGTTYIRSLYGFNEVAFILEFILHKREMTFSLKKGIVKRYFEEFLIEA